MTPVNQEETNNIELRKETEMIKRIKITGNYGYTTEYIPYKIKLILIKLIKNNSNQLIVT